MSSPVPAPVPSSTLAPAAASRAPGVPASALPRKRPLPMELWERWRRPRRWPVWLLGAWCGALFFFGIGGIELWRTESLRAIIAQGMLTSGDWIVPRLYGEPLFTKPPGMYAAIALLSAPFGQVTEWTARLPSALAATLTVFLFYWYVKNRLGQMPGLVAALTLPLGPMWLDKGSAAEIDMLQVAWVAGCLIFFFRALEEHDRQSPPRVLWRWWLAAMLCMAGGLLTKWTAPAFFYATAITLLWRRGQLRLSPCRRRHRRCPVPDVDRRRHRPRRLGHLLRHRLARGLGAICAALSRQSLSLVGSAAPPPRVAGDHVAALRLGGVDAAAELCPALGRAGPASAARVPLLGLAQRDCVEPDDRAHAAP
jgi:Dolichyl-phosphate-mannose-protein mannosyltransferase